MPPSFRPRASAPGTAKHTPAAQFLRDPVVVVDRDQDRGDGGDELLALDVRLSEVGGRLVDLALQLVVRGAQPVRHLVEPGGPVADLVLGADTHVVIEVSAGDAVHSVLELSDGFREPAAEDVGEDLTHRLHVHRFGVYEHAVHVEDNGRDPHAAGR